MYKKYYVFFVIIYIILLTVLFYSLFISNKNGYGEYYQKTEDNVYMEGESEAIHYKRKKYVIVDDEDIRAFHKGSPFLYFISFPESNIAKKASFNVYYRYNFLERLFKTDQPTTYYKATGSDACDVCYIDISGTSVVTFVYCSAEKESSFLEYYSNANNYTYSIAKHMEDEGTSVRLSKGIAQEITSIGQNNNSVIIKSSESSSIENYYLMGTSKDGIVDSLVTFCRYEGQWYINYFDNEDTNSDYVELYPVSQIMSEFFDDAAKELS